MLRVLVAIIPFAIGCMSYNVQPYGTFDGSKKTMTVGRGGGGLVGTLKRALVADGWKLAADRGPNVSQSTVTTEGSRTEGFNTFNTRYRLGCGSTWRDLAISGGNIYEYDISIVDNETGEEILTMCGRGIESTIAEELIKAIRQNSR